LVGAPNMDEVENFNKNNYPLHRVAIKEWEGFIYICLSDKAESFDGFFRPLKNKFNAWQLSKLKTIENDVYNCVLNYQDTPSNFDRVKILHLAGIAQRPHLFNHYFQIVEQELERRQ